jgi:hypothetical protein
VKLPKKKCRCCGGPNFERCGSRPVTPFFSKFGLHLEIAYQARGKRFFRYFPKTVYEIFSRSIRNLLLARIEIAYGACQDCKFIAPWPELSDDMLLDYYLFYLGGTYKTERKNLEACYQEILNKHGSIEELNIRQMQHVKFIMPILEEERKINQIREIRMLDYSGEEGIVTPREEWIEADVFDYGSNTISPIHRSNDKSHPTVQQEIGKYDFIQALHVFEHVGDPKRVLENAIHFLKPNGLLYIEVPWEMTDFDTFIRQGYISCDEHINKFCDSSVRALIAGAGLHCLSCQEGFIELLHNNQPMRVVRCLGRKP